MNRRENRTENRTEIDILRELLEREDNSSVVSRNRSRSVSPNCKPTRPDKHCICVRDGKDGRPGKDGKNGRDGNCGKDGKCGKDGCKGDKGDRGCDGKDGRPGRDGKDGKDGCNGKNGCDAISNHMVFCGCSFFIIIGHRLYKFKKGENTHSDVYELRDRRVIIVGVTFDGTFLLVVVLDKNGVRFLIRIDPDTGRMEEPARLDIR